MGVLPSLLAGFEGNPQLLPEQLILGILTGSIYALIALGYTMVYGILKLINFAHGEIYMLGAYIGLFVSWAAIGLPGEAAMHILAPSTVAAIGYGLMAGGVLVGGAWYAIAKARGLKTMTAVYAGTSMIAFGILTWVLANYQPNAITLVVMMLASMVGCAIIGVTIEFFAYRPMRDQPRIAVLITAIGVSLLLQYTGQIFLPTSPPRTVPESVNPYSGSITIPLKPAPAELVRQYYETEAAFNESQTQFNRRLKEEGWEEFDLPPEGKELRDEFQELRREMFDLQGKKREQSIIVTLPTGQVLMFFTAIVLMFLLRHLVMNTAVGRGMRAVSHDHQAAALMGVNVNQIITFTFIIGSALAGAAAMMNSTFLGTPLTSFYGFVPGVKAFVAAVLGGIGNIRGAVLGGLLMGVAESLVVWANYSSLKDAVAFVILIVVLLLRPGGLLGSSEAEKV